MKKRFTIMIAAIIMLLTMLTLPGKVWATEVTLSWSSAPTITNNAFTQDGVTLTFTKGSTANNNGPAYNGGTSQLRMYAGWSLTITVDQATLNSIAYTYTLNKSNKQNISVSGAAGDNNAGTYSNNTWTGSDSSVTFTTTGTSGNVGFTQIVVNYTTSGGSTTPTTTTINVPNNFNNNMYNNNTTGGTLTASVTVTEGGAAVGGASVTWNSTNTNVATVAANGSVTLVGTGNTNITASYAGDATYSSSTSAPFALTVINQDPNAPGTINNPYTVAQARAAIDAGTGITDVYAAGIIYQVDSYNSTYHSITYWISDDGTNTNPLEVYGGLGLDDSSNQFTTTSNLAVGDKVMVYGTLKKYNSTYEFDKDNRLKVLIRATDANITYDATSGEITNIKVGGNISGGSFSAAVQSGEDWLSSPTLDLVNNEVTFTATANASASPRNGTIRIIYTYNTDKTFYKDVTITQGGAPQPLITVDANEIAVPNYVKGTPANAISYEVFNVSGTNLQGNISLTLENGASSKFEMSDDLDTWGNSITLTQTSGTVDETEIAIRLKSGIETVAAYSDKIILTSLNATNENVDISGSVTYATLTYNGNGSDGGTVPAAVTNCTYNQSIEVAEPGTMSKTHYTFSVWNTKADGSGNNYDPAEEDTYTITADAILYAQWTINNHTITMPGTDTYGSYTSSPASTADYNAEVTLTFTPNTGYEMYEPTWSVNGDAIEGNKFNMPDEDVIVTVELTEKNEATYDFSEIDFSGWNNQYLARTVSYSESTIYFASASKQNSGQQIDDIPVTKGGDVSIVLNTGYTLTGVTFVCRQWGSKTQTITLHYSRDGGDNYTATTPTSTNFTITKNDLVDGTNAVKITFSSSSNQVGIESATLRFAGQKYAISLASVSNGTISSDKTTASAGQLVNLTATPSSGYAFDRWDIYKTGDSETKVTVSNNQFEMPNYPVTVSAVFSAAYTITYSLNGVTSTESYVQGATITLPTPTENIPTGYSFVGWSINANDASTILTTTYTVSASTTLYAAFGKVTSITMSNTDFGAYGDNTIDYTIGGYTFRTYKVGNYSNSIQFQSNNGYIYNTDVFNNLISIITVQSGDYKTGMVLKIGNTANPSEGTSITPSNSGNTDTYLLSSSAPYIWLKSNSSNAVKFSSITFNFCNPEGPRYTRVVSEDVTDDITITSPTYIAAGSVVNMGAYNISCNNASNLVIEDGGQLIISNDVAATVKKDIAKYDNATDKDGWYTIASPAEANVSLAQLGTYDLFAYDEGNHQWRNVKIGGNNITTFAQGQGFLYANSANQTLPFAGTMKASDATVTVQLSYESADGKLKGFNLVGNPFTCNVTSEMVTMNGEPLTTYYVAEGGSNLVTRNLANTPIKPGRGFFVQAPSECDLVFNPGAKGEMDYKPTFISIEAGNGEFADRAYVQLGYGNTLRKMSINDNTPMVYVMNNDADYAAATVNALKGTMPVCFRAKETGHYTISVATEGLDMSYLHLIDCLTGADIDLLIEPSYSFIATKDDNQSRFILSFTADCFNEDEDEIFAYQNGNEIFVNGEGELQVFDVMGHMVATQRINGVETVNIPAQGVYIMRLNEKTQKIVVR